MAMPISTASDPRLRCVLPFEAVSEEVGLLRRAAAQQLARWGMRVTGEEAEVIVTELATNVIKHVGEGVSATLVLEWRGDRLRLELHDRCPALPSLRSVDFYDECGRGLHLVAGLAADWGAVHTAAGKMVWCDVLVCDGVGSRRIARAAEALERYRGAGTAVGGSGPSPRAGLAESAVQLIADLLHWTAARGYDPDDILDRSQMRYEAELDAA